MEAKGCSGKDANPTTPANPSNSNDDGTSDIRFVAFRTFEWSYWLLQCKGFGSELNQRPLQSAARKISRVYFAMQRQYKYGASLKNEIEQ